MITSGIYLMGYVEVKTGGIRSGNFNATPAPNLHQSDYSTVIETNADGHASEEIPSCGIKRHVFGAIHLCFAAVQLLCYFS